MKNFLLLIVLSLGSFFAKAQSDDIATNNKAEKIQALKVAFITQKLDLSPEEAQKFWPVYDSYQSDVSQLLNNNQNSDVLDNDEKLLNLRKKYRTQFVNVLGQPRMNKLFNAEKEFRGILLRRLKNNQGQQRPLRRRN